MNRSRMMQIVIGVGLLVILGQTVYTVSEIEQVIITQFGDPVGDPVVNNGAISSQIAFGVTIGRCCGISDVGRRPHWVNAFVRRHTSRAGSSPCRLSRHVRRGSTHS